MQYHSSLLLLCNSLSLVLWGFYSAYVVQEGLISLPPALGPKRWMFGLELMDQDPLSSQLQLLAPRWVGDSSVKLLRALEPLDPAKPKQLGGGGSSMSPLLKNQDNLS